jgi:hypothetical protein
MKRRLAFVLLASGVLAGCSSPSSFNGGPRITTTSPAVTTTPPTTTGTTAPPTIPPTSSIPKQTTTTVDDLPGGDADCGQSGLCEAKATCAAWAWSDQYIQDATNEDNLFIDLRLQAGSDNPVSTNSRAGQDNSPYNAMITDSGNAAYDSGQYQILSDKVNDIDNAINNITGYQGNDQGQLQHVSGESESLGNWCSEYAS